MRRSITGIAAALLTTTVAFSASAHDNMGKHHHKHMMPTTPAAAAAVPQDAPLPLDYTWSGANGSTRLHNNSFRYIVGNAFFEHEAGYCHHDVVVAPAPVAPAPVHHHHHHHHVVAKAAPVAPAKKK